jgi:hypothetical protein
VRGMQRYMDFMSQGWTGGLHDFWEEGFLQVKQKHHDRREYADQRNGSGGRECSYE